MIMLLSGFNWTHALHMYDCITPKFGRIYSLIDTHDCLYDNPNNITSTDETYSVYQEAEFYKTEVKECRVKKSTFKSHCGLHSHSSIIIMKLIPREVEIALDTWDYAFTTGIFKWEMEKIEVKKNTVVRKTLIHGTLKDDGECKGETSASDPVRTTNLQIELLSYERTFDMKTGLLLNNPSCTMNRDFCVTPSATLIYTAKKENAI